MPNNLILNGNLRACMLANVDEVGIEAKGILRLQRADQFDM